MTITPISLLDRLRQPADQAAWARFVDLYSPLVFSWARQAGRQPADAAELGISVGTVYAAKCRVLARLRQELAGMWE